MFKYHVKDYSLVGEIISLQITILWLMGVNLWKIQKMKNKELLQQENSKVHQEVLDANLNYAESFGEKSNLALPPSRQFAILTCMDARLDPAKYAGLS